MKLRKSVPSTATGPTADELTTTAAATDGDGRLGRIRDYGIVGTFVVLFVALSLSSSAFLTSTNLLNILDQSAMVGIIACGGTLVIIAGGFDLSVGAIFAFASVAAAGVANHVDPIVGLLAGIAAGVLLGVANGLIITRLRVNTFIATLASSYVFRGIATLLTGGFLVAVASNAFTVPGTYELFSMKFTIWIFVAVAVVLGFVLARTAFGRYVYAVGGNPEAARLSGVHVNRIRVATFAISGMCAGIAGMLAASQDATGSAAGGMGLELSAIAAIVIGGTSIYGGEGAVWRSVLGVLLIALINNGFNLLSINPFYQSVVQGAIIIVAVALDQWARKSARTAL